MHTVESGKVRAMSNSEIFNALKETIDFSFSRDELGVMCRMYLDLGTEKQEILQTLEQVHQERRRGQEQEQLIFEVMDDLRTNDLLVFKLPERKLNS